MWYYKTCNIALPPRPEVRGIPRGFDDVKAAYIFSDVNCSNQIKKSTLLKLPSKIEQPTPTKLQHAAELKSSR